MTTDHDLDRIAYEACGYIGLWRGGFGEWYGHREGLNTNMVKPLEPWSSTDAAIGHAKKAGFYLGAISDDTYKDEPVMVMLWHPKKAIRIHGKAPSLGLAIRNAIVAWTQKGAE